MLGNVLANILPYSTPNEIQWHNNMTSMELAEQKRFTDYVNGIAIIFLFQLIFHIYAVYIV